MLDIAMVSIDLDPTTRVALVGQLSAAGDARAAGIMTGLVAGAFIKGMEAFYPAGTKFAAWTRDELWLRAAAPSPASDRAGVSVASREFLFGANTRRDPASVDLSFPCSGEVSEVKLVGVGEWGLPEPVAATSVTRQAETCTARFAGWSVLRHVRASETAEPLRIRARSGESELHIDLPARLRVE
jgi:hypothetical protein